MTVIQDGDASSTSTNNGNGNTTSTSWTGWKERGKQAYIRGDYDVALQAYAQAVHQHRSGIGPSTLDQQLLLSNMVACRLKLGGTAQAEAAVATAKTCIALNNQWAKGHVRLASAYIALGGNGDDADRERRTTYSNDACNALQRALQLDPGNPTARDMLIRELRSRDNRHANGRRSSDNNNANGHSRGAPSPSAPPQHMDNTTNQESSSSSYQTQNQEQQQHSSAPQDQQNYNNTYNDIDIDESNSMSWQERFQFQIQRAKLWYSAQSEDIRTVLKVALAFLFLYVAFGGRFGLEYFFNGSSSSSSSRNTANHHRRADVYEEFYRNRNERNQRNLQQEEDRYQYRERHDPYSSHDSSSSSSSHRGRRSRSSSSWWGNSGTSSSSGYGYYSYMLLLAGVAYVAQRFFGISPYQAIFFVNMLMGRRGGGIRGRRHFGGGGGWGNMMGGGGGWGNMMGGGFGAGNIRHNRPGGMWG